MTVINSHEFFSNSWIQQQAKSLWDTLWPLILWPRWSSPRWSVGGVTAEAPSGYHWSYLCSSLLSPTLPIRCSRWFLPTESIGCCCLGFSLVSVLVCLLFVRLPFKNMCNLYLLSKVSVRISSKGSKITILLKNYRLATIVQAKAIKVSLNLLTYFCDITTICFYF